MTDTTDKALDALVVRYRQVASTMRRMKAATIEAHEMDAGADTITALRAQLAVYEAAGIVEVAARNPSVMDYMRHWEGRAERAEAQLATARADAVRVKPLVWHQVNALFNDEWMANALGGAFHIAPDEDSACGAWIMQWTICHEDFCMSYGGAISLHVDAEAAKAAAQADYEARILAALEPTPSAPSPEAVARAALEHCALRIDVLADEDESGDYSFDAGWEAAVKEAADIARFLASHPESLAAIITKAGGGE
jgi:hypothetical protein